MELKPSEFPLLLFCNSGVEVMLDVAVALVELRAVELRAVELRAVELRAVELRAVELRAVELRAVELRAVELVEFSAQTELDPNPIDNIVIMVSAKIFFVFNALLLFKPLLGSAYNYVPFIYKNVNE